MKQDNFHINKTKQDLQPAGKRDRVHEWNKRREWAKKHKPRKSSDWYKFGRS